MVVHTHAFDSSKQTYVTQRDDCVSKLRLLVFTKTKNARSRHYACMREDNKPMMCLFITEPTGKQ